MQITKTPKMVKQKPRVCAYARVSTDKLDQANSLAAQTDYWNRRFTQDPDVEYIGLFMDDGISGKHMKNRKGLNDMLAIARNGEIDAIYVKSISRFARNYTEITAVIRELRDMGVPIIFEKEGIDTLDPKCNLILSVMSSMAEEELNSMSKNARWATRKRFAEGSIELGKIYGYDYRKGKLTINPRLEQQATKLDTEIYDKLKKSILQYAIQGKLVEQDENDDPASALLERIRAEKKAQLGKKHVESYIYKGDDNCYYEHIGGKDVNITEEIPFDLPNGWSFERLGNIIDIASGINITSAEMAKTEQLFPVYGGNGINGFYDKFNVESNTIVIGRVGFYCGSVHTTKTKSWVTDNALIVSYSVDNIILPYMEVLLRYADFGKKSSSTAQPLVTGKIIRPYVVAIPPLAEQKRIVDKINEIFAKL